MKISTTYALRKIMYAYDLVIVAEHREELQGALEEWNYMLYKPRQDRSYVCWETTLVFCFLGTFQQVLRAFPSGCLNF